MRKKRSCFAGMAIGLKFIMIERLTSGRGRDLRVGELLLENHSPKLISFSARGPRCLYAAQRYF